MYKQCALFILIASITNLNFGASQVALHEEEQQHKIRQQLSLQLLDCLKVRSEFFVEQTLSQIYKYNIPIINVGHMNLAAATRDVEVVEMLAEHGGPLDSTDARKRTPLFYAAAGGKFRTVRFLCGKGARVNSVDEDGSSPLHKAAKSGCAITVSILLKHYADPILRDNIGRTPLHNALSVGNSEIALLLLRAGASWLVEDENQVTPLSLAQKKYLTEVLDYISKNTQPQHHR